MTDLKRFSEIEEMAVAHHGREAVDARLSVPRAAAELAKMGDDRILAEMTKRIFQAGFSWKVIEAKWDGFEAAFEGFDPRRVAAFTFEDIERLTGDTRIVRHGKKITSVTENAAFLLRLAGEHGSAARFIASWPDDDMVGLMAFLKKNGSRLGGNTGQYFLRFIGRDSFIFSRDVNAALVREGVIDKPATAKRDMLKAQAALNHWREETGRPACQISQILAMSVG